jgi:hypothetical protein
MSNGDENHASVAAGCAPKAWVSATVVKRDGLMPAKAQGRFEGSRVADLTHCRTRVLTRLELAKLNYIWITSHSHRGYHIHVEVD